MQVKPLEWLIDAGSFSKSPEWSRIYTELTEAIATVVWPPGSTSFALNPTPHGNGVKPIKEACMLHLQSLAWELGTRLKVATQVSPGPMDATCSVGDRFFCLEWETGNISSSHRALNKMALGILREQLIGGALILPTRDMARYLTQRVGNLPEMAPYFPLWRSLHVDEGLLVVIPIEHDHLDPAVPVIRKVTDGRALV